MNVKDILSEKYPDLDLVKSFPFEDVIVCVMIPKRVKKDAKYDRQFCLAVTPDGEVKDFDMKRAADNSAIFYESMRRG